MKQQSFSRLAAIALFALGSSGPTLAQSPAPSSPAPIVFFDIAGPNIAAQRAFYEKVFGWTLSPGFGGAINVTVPIQAPTLSGVLRADPGADVLLYVGVDDITATLKTIEANGGKVQSPRTEVKGVVVLGLFRDPAGNLLGLVEMKDGKAKIP